MTFLIFINKVNHFKSLFRYSQNFLSPTYLCKIVIKSCRFDFRFFPGLYRGLPISCQLSSSSFETVQLVRLCFSSFSEKIQESARSFPGKQNSVTSNNLLITNIPLISKARLGVSSSTTYFYSLLRWSVNWEQLVKDCSKWRKRSRSLKIRFHKIE